MKEQLISLLDSLDSDGVIAFQTATTEDSLYQAKVGLLGKKGKLTDILKNLGQTSAEDRPQIGAKANLVRDHLEQVYNQSLVQLRDQAIHARLRSETIDVTLPGFQSVAGHRHPISQMMSELKKIFREIGFDLAEGPEIETDYYNFEALNIPPAHPARDMQDTFYLGGLDSSPLLLRTHTSPVQIRVMENKKPPIAIASPGVVYRRDSDVSHTPMFHQIEGLLVDKGINLTHLKGTIELFLRKIFGHKTPVRFRPSYFPFTEPSAEVDIGCVFCHGAGGSCRLCKGTGWIEILGCGLVDPEVFRFVKIDSEVYSGFAFGVGIERLTMLKYGINDLRLFFENSVQFLKQF